MLHEIRTKMADMEADRLDFERKMAVEIDRKMAVIERKLTEERREREKTMTTLTSTEPRRKGSRRRA